MKDYYSDETIMQVRNLADIRYCVPGADPTKATSYVPCPKCGSTGKNKGLCVTHKGNKNMAKCFKCDFVLKDALDATYYYKCSNVKSRYPEAIKATAEACGLHIMSENEKKAAVKPVRRTRKEAVKSFCQQQLEASGLTEKDVMVKTVTFVKGERLEIMEPSMRRGSLDKTGQVHPGDDEMLIYYYNLDGSMAQYALKGSRSALRPYIRVRWSNPELHTKEGSSRLNKYQTPAGAPTRFYIPQKIRDLYNGSVPIDTLLIQEGEKKAEKACKHGIPSLAIQGIYNIGNKDLGLNQELQYIIQRCQVKNVVLMFDSDWDHLSEKINTDDSVDYRPKMFSGAAVKFKRYVGTLHNMGLDVDIYFGHINENDQGDKGIDDLLVGTLKGKEEELAKDIEFAVHSHDGVGKYCSAFCISTKSELQIQDYWLLNDSDRFFEKYKEKLVPLRQFKFNRFRYKVNDEGNIELASKVIADKEFWDVHTNDNTGRISVSLLTYEALMFVEQAGFYRIHTDDLPTGEYRFIQIEDGVAYKSSPADIRDFVWNYIMMTTKDPVVLNHFSARLTNDLSTDKLERLGRKDDNFDEYEPYRQCLYFRNGMVTITPETIKNDSVISGPVWEHRMIKHDFERVQIFERVEQDPATGSIRVVPTEAGKNCDFLNFLMCTSNFWWQQGGPKTDDEKTQYNQHLMNKLTAIGYLLTDYKYQTELKAVIAMDGEMSDVGQSNGRTGKSMIGVALSYVMNQARIDGRKTKNDDDFMFTEVTLRTRNVFFDDVPVNFNFERLYVTITGDMSVNVKGGARFSIPGNRSPKLYIATNHAINGSQSRSSMERIIYIGFSNFFNDMRTPMEYFGHQFFEDWNHEQWNLFYNLMVECVFLYFTSMQQEWVRPGQGVVKPPMHDIMQRTLRQQMSESIYQWAEVYFDITSNIINTKQPRKVIYDDFKSSFPDSRSGISQSNFKTKLQFYCQFKGFHFNPNKLNKEGRSFRSWIADHPGESFIGGDDKSGGVEYFSIYDTEHAMREPF